jgi:hypothetical protein
MTLQIITLVLLAMIGSVFLVYFKEGAELTISLNKGVMFGISQADNYFEDDKETDYNYQVALGVLVLTLTWTRKDAE